MNYIYTNKHPVFEGRRIIAGAPAVGLKVKVEARYLRAGVIEEEKRPKKTERPAGGED